MKCYVPNTYIPMFSGQRRFIAGNLVFIMTLLSLGNAASQDPILEALEASKTLKQLEDDAGLAEEAKQWDVFLLDVKSNVEQRVTNTAVEELRPVISEDERLLAFTSSGGTLVIQDLVADSVMFKSGAGEVYENPYWVPKHRELSVQKRLVLEHNVSHEKLISYAVTIQDPNGANEVKLTDPTQYTVYNHSWNVSGSQLAVTGKNLTNDSCELNVLQNGVPLEMRLVYVFLKEETPSDVVWLAGGEQLAVLTHREGKVSVMLKIDVTSGNKVEIYDVGFSSGEFDMEPTTGRIVLTGDALNLEEIPIPEDLADTLVIPGGYDFRWRQGGAQILFKARRYPRDFIENLKRGAAPRDDRLFILVDGGLIESKDPDDKYSLYVREALPRENNQHVDEFIGMTLQEAQEFAAKHIPSLTLESDGPKFAPDREGKVSK